MKIRDKSRLFSVNNVSLTMLILFEYYNSFIYKMCNEITSVVHPVIASFDI